MKGPDYAEIVFSFVGSRRYRRLYNPVVLIVKACEVIERGHAFREKEAP